MLPRTRPERWNLRPGGQHHFIAMEHHIAEGAVIAAGSFGCFGMVTEVAPGFGASDGMKDLCRG